MKIMFPKRSICILLMILIFFEIIAIASPPPPPENFYGNVYINGEIAGQGHLIDARNASGSSNLVSGSDPYTDGTGRYGFSESALFYISGFSEGETIYFFVDDYSSNTSVYGWTPTRLDLSITTGNTVVTSNKPLPSGGSSGGQVDNPKSTSPAPQTNATVQSTPIVQQTVPVQTTFAPENVHSITPSGTLMTSAIDGGLSIITLLFAGIILRTIRKK